MLSLLLLALAPTHSDEPTIWDRLDLYANGRVRWESTFEQTNGEDRHRGRFRFRLGGMYKLDDKLNVHARMSTSSDGVDANNPHWDFGDGGDGFEGAELVLDRLFVEWLTTDWLTLQAGKFPHAFTAAPIYGEFIWDADVQPAGFAAKLTCTESKKKLDLRLVKYTAVESGSDDDPSMVGAQINATCESNEDLAFHFASSFSHWSNLNPGTGAFQNQGNRVDGAGNFVSDFAIWDTFIDATHTGGPLGRQQAFAEFWDNTKESSQRGYSIGARVGDSRKPGDFNLFAFWAEMDEDSIFTPVAQDDLPITGSGAGNGIEAVGYGGEYRVNEDTICRLWALNSHSDMTDNPFRVRLDLNFNIRNK